MKKILFLLIVSLLLTVTTSAQVIVGGALSFSASNQTSTNWNNGNENLSKNPSTFSFGISPKVGYLINEKWEVGAKLDLNYNQSMNYVVLRDNEGVNPKALKDYKTSYFRMSIDPYARWCAVNVKGFGVWLEGLVSLGTNFTPKNKFYPVQYGNDGVVYRSEIEADALNDTPIQTKTSNFNGGLYIQPVLTYAFNEHCRLETTLNFLGFNLSGSVQKSTTAEGDWHKTNTCNFGLNIDSENALVVEYLTIGFTYVL